VPCIAPHATRGNSTINSAPRSFSRNHADLATVCLHNLIDDGEPQARAAFKTRLKRLKNLGSLPGVEADAGVAERDAQPERMRFELYGERAAVRHRPQGVIAEIPEDLLDFVGVHAGTHLVPVKRALNPVLGPNFRLFLH